MNINKKEQTKILQNLAKLTEENTKLIHENQLLIDEAKKVKIPPKPEIDYTKIVEEKVFFL